MTLSLTNADRAAIRATVTAQLEAFQQDDGDRAFSYASPDIRAKMGTAANFMYMVRAAYDPVYRPRSVLFGDLTHIEDTPAQTVMLHDRHGHLITALYLMERQSDRSWKISGCFLVPMEDDPPTRPE
ncbi:MAG: DUF4864 domain-containing protein [Cyanobacteria bacterium J06639_1]